MRSTKLKKIQIPNSVFIAEIVLLKRGNTEFRPHLIPEHQSIAMTLKENTNIGKEALILPP